MVNLHKKILIIGDAGRGKSTLSSRLSEKLKIPHCSTDDYFYEVKFTKKRDRQEAYDLILKFFNGDKWIVEGTTRYLLKPGMEMADTIIYLRHKSLFCQAIVLFKRWWNGKDDTLFNIFGIVKHSFAKKYRLGDQRGKKTYAEMIEPYKDKAVVLSSFSEIDEFVERL
ncbi:MAG: hypothetical protein WC797_02950 [Candidatus Paceibacterota bacterium]|jgi:adenylate kinase family enzyme